jgi:hypothetical protein
MPATTLSWSYIPPGASLKAFRQSDAFARALYGPDHMGRKSCALYDILLRARAHAEQVGWGVEWRWAVVAASRTELDIVIDGVHDWIPPALGRWRDKEPAHRIEFMTPTPQGDRLVFAVELVFLALGEPMHDKRWRQMRATGVWLCSASALDEALFDNAIAIAGTWPDALHGGAPWSGVICTSRMPTEGHWLVTRPELVRFRQPGWRSDAAENPAVRARVLAGIERKPEDWVRVHIDGEFATRRQKSSLAQAIFESYRLDGAQNGAAV